MTKTAVEVAGLRKRYGAGVAVEDVGFATQAGEIFGIQLQESRLQAKITVREALELWSVDSGHDSASALIRSKVRRMPADIDAVNASTLTTCQGVDADPGSSSSHDGHAGYAISTQRPGSTSR